MPTLVVKWLLTFTVHWVHVKRVVLPNLGACQGRQTWRFKIMETIEDHFD